MKINLMICPQCGHQFFTDCAYGTCDACQTYFTASESRTRRYSQNVDVTVHGDSSGFDFNPFNNSSAYLFRGPKQQ